MEDHLNFVDSVLADRWQNMERNQSALARIIHDGKIEDGDGQIAAQCLQLILLEIASRRCKRYLEERISA